MIDKKLLVSAFEKASKAVGENALLPVFQCFRIKGDTIVTTDGICTIQTKLPELATLNLDCAIPARIFLDLIKNLSVKEVDIIVEDDKLTLSSTGLKGKFVTLDKSALLPIPDFSKVEWKEIAGDFLHDLALCRLVVSKDETSGVLCGVQIKDDRSFGTDKYRVVRTILKTPTGVNAIFPAKYVDIAGSFKAEVASIGVDRACFYIQLKDGTIVSTVLLEGVYPDMNQFFVDMDMAAMEKITFPAAIQELVERHITFLREVRDVDKETQVKVDGTKITFTSVEEKLGTLEEDITLATAPTTNFTFAINPIFLKEMSGAVKEFYYGSGRGIVTFQRDNFQYMVLTKRNA